MRERDTVFDGSIHFERRQDVRRQFPAEIQVAGSGFIKAAVNQRRDILRHAICRNATLHGFGSGHFGTFRLTDSYRLLPSSEYGTNAKGGSGCTTHTCRSRKYSNNSRFLSGPISRAQMTGDPLMSALLNTHSMS